MLRHGCQDVDSELVGVRIIGSHEFNAAVHQRGNEGQIARQPIELGDDKLRLLLLAGRERCGELWAIGVLAGLHLGEFAGQRPATAVQIVQDGLLLRFQT